MQKTEREYREDIVEIGRIVWQKGWIASNDGNITVRLDEDRILCTPTGMCKGMMQPDDLIVCDMNGCKIAGAKESTSELAMHLAIYDLRPDVRSVVHAHPPVATGYATAGRSLDLALLPEVVIDLGCVPLAGYGLPGTPELTARMLPLIPRFDAMLMANHGAVCYGEDLHQAFFRMETTEHLARISLVAELLGGPKVLPRIEVDKLIESRARYGVKARAADPRCPVAAEEAGEERFVVTRAELLALVDAALRARVSGQ
jgi:L-fuculose-phosphate aldolase